MQPSDGHTGGQRTSHKRDFLAQVGADAQGQAGQAEHILAPGDIPVIQVDRGGQVTYHGPGQIVAYPLIDIKRLGMGVRELVRGIEKAIIGVLQSYGLEGSVIAGDKHGVVVATGEGLLRLEQVQMPGKRPIGAGEFANAYPLADVCLGS